NDFFLDDVPNLDKIIIKYFNDETTAEVALENGVINFTTPVDPAILTRASEYSALVVSKDGYEALGALSWLEFNTKNKYLSKRKVRQALAYATNVKFIINRLQDGFSKRSASPI